jgi:hypothetical protein
VNARRNAGFSWTAQEQILAYALVFGFAQQALSQLLDKAAQNLMSGLQGTTRRRPLRPRRVQSTSWVAIVRSGDRARLWTRNRHEISDQFPDVVAAAVGQLPDGVVLDGELVILSGDGRLSFDTLQQRLVTSPARAGAKAAELPASFAAFDVLTAGGVDLRTQRWTVQRLDGEDGRL